MELIWQNRGGQLYRDYPAQEQDKLENIVYVLGFNPNYGQFYLTPRYKEFGFEYKLYDLQTSFINRFCRTYSCTKGNLGALLNGTKGTGKTVTTKLIANKLAKENNMPIIVVDRRWEELHPEKFLNMIPQDIIILIDEYEKIYADSNDMLTIMDGTLNAQNRRVFLFTTNKLYIEDNLKQRPSRLRYLKTFSDLQPSVVEEIIEDCLVHKEFKNELMSFITTLELITVDIVKQIIQEVNIHKEGPSMFEDDFNVKKREGKYNVFEVDEKGNSKELMSNVHIYPRPEFEEDIYGYNFEANNTHIGVILEIINENCVLVGLGETMSGNYEETIMLRVERAYKYHSNYAYGTYDDVASPRYTNTQLTSNLNKSKIDEDFQNRIFLLHEKQNKIREEKQKEVAEPSLRFKLEHLSIPRIVKKNKLTESSESSKAMDISESSGS